MVNDLVLPQLPAHLASLAGNTALAAVNAAVMATASASSFHRISIKQSRWRLNDPQGQEAVVPQLHLDVIIVGANPHKSKLWYAGAYDPAATEFKAPDCYSDNGIAPSVGSTKPQSKSCAECPHNVWGSKITPGGKQTKACADALKIAVLLAENPTGAVYQLKLPAASLANIGNYVKQLNDKGVPIAALVTRLTFDAQAEYPKVLFTPIGYATPEQAHAINEVLGSDEIDSVIGTNDKPITATTLAPVQTAAATPAPAPAPTLASTPQPTQAPTAAPVKRTRRAAPTAAEAPAPAPAPAVASAGSFFDTLKASQAAQPATPAAAVKTAMPATNEALDDLIAKALQA